jgi:hypothetical protein
MGWNGAERRALFADRQQRARADNAGQKQRELYRRTGSTDNYSSGRVEKYSISWDGA